ncbi:AAA family ATPase [Oscillibacter ruminantium]|uniref:AAA family ATPase n=1 Tax=Oscillibacter ruminantium TaxID=1263547 RepID=UPI00332BC620
MFTKVHVQNFKCFSDLEFDLTGRGGTPKNLILIYGENGAGKSNIAAIFYALVELMQTMDINDIYQQLLNMPGIEEDTPAKTSQFLNFVKSNIRDLPSIYRDIRMNNAQGNTVLTFEFLLAEKAGIYSIELLDGKIIRETLKFVLEQRQVTYFDLSAEEENLNKSVFSNRSFFQDVLLEKQKFWGKHSFLSILRHEIVEKSTDYIAEFMPRNLFRVLSFFASVNATVNQEKKGGSLFELPSHFLDLNHGDLPADEVEPRLAHARNLVLLFFTSINSDIKDAYYKTERNEDTCSYQLYLKRLISGQIREISFEKESTGNQRMLGFLSNLVHAANGGIEIIDEIDSGVHDLAAQKIIQDLSPVLDGQMIITTHNTMLMECQFSREATYVLEEDEQANRTIKCVNSYNERLYQKTNIRRKYLDGDFKGVPQIKDIPFPELIKQMEMM